jgi:hypothetical protein
MKTKTNTNTQTTTPSVVSTPTAPVPAGGFTIGLDLGDRSHYVCVLDAAGQILHEGVLSNTRPALAIWEPMENNRDSNGMKLRCHSSAG